MERITEKAKDGSNVIRCTDKNHVSVSYIGYTDGAYFGSIVDRLAEYEDAEESGLIVRFPCKVGDKLWCIHTNRCGNQSVIECTVAKIMYNTYHSGNDYGRNLIRCLTVDGYDMNVLFFRVGSVAFFTKEEAEAALKESQISG